MPIAAAESWLLTPGTAVDEMDDNKKLFRVADLALVVYRGSEIVGVKHSELSPWLAWDLKNSRWDKALPEHAKAFELLPLAGSVEN